jgi:hypothetical protein
MTEVLTAYAKTWEKNSNIRASQDLISNQLDIVRQTTGSHVFAAPQQPFPHFLTASSTSIQPLVRVSSKLVMPKIKRGVKQLSPLLSTPTSLYLVRGLCGLILHEVQNYWQICPEIPCMYLFPIQSNV